MGELQKQNNSKYPNINEQQDLIDTIQELVLEKKTSIKNKQKISVPIVKISTLGVGMASLVSAFSKINNTNTLTTDSLFTIANSSVGDTLKMAKNGNAWGAMKTADGGSKMVQLAKASPTTIASQTVSAFNPTIMIMAVALYSIEK